LDLNPRETASKIQAENLAFMRAAEVLLGRLHHIGGLRFLECLLEWEHGAKGFAFMKLDEQDRYVSVRETFVNMRSGACPHGDVGSRQKHCERRYE